MVFAGPRGDNPVMITRRTRLVASLALLAGFVAFVPAPRVRAAADTIPARLTDQEFWRLSEELSEPNGSFRSDNMLSNEIWFQTVIRDLLARTQPGGVYLGVGPEQNFTYIAAIKPKIVFITDVRRGNLHMHLMYKALFELSKDRAEFVSRLFTKPRPERFTEQTSAAEMWGDSGYWNIQTGDQKAFDKNLQDVYDVLQKKHGLNLSKEDLDGIYYCYHNFYWYGPSINYNSTSNTTGGRGGGNMVDYSTLMMQTDGAVNKSYMGSEENFKFLKDLEERNMLVPVVGNFGGPKALRAVGKWVRDHGATITAMYLSNVEQYLTQDNIWGNFCGNVASMPLDEHSTFIRSQTGGGGGGSGLMSQLGSMQADTRGCGIPLRPGSGQAIQSATPSVKTAR
jgi:hypothetical protein